MLSKQNTWVDHSLIKSLQYGNVVVMPTDTLYGIVGKTFNSNTVERIYLARKRAPEKPCIVLIGNLEEIEKFSITLSETQKNIIKNFSTPTSFILDCLDESLAYLHRGTNTLAFRLPKDEELRNLLLKTGPLIAPSANTEGMPPSENIDDAKKYFGDKVDLYMNAGDIKGSASKVIKLQKDGSITVLRN